MEKSSFTLVFGESPFVKVLDFFLTYEDFDYPISFISKETETKWETIEKIVEMLIKKGFIKKTRKLGKAWLYALDKENKLTKLLIHIDMKISDFYIKKEIKRQGTKIQKQADSAR
ncbi:hypothetical protein HYT23_04490 [Candidatus Pacearchaeota archaeon]|nr:hypothetical protein [Candidatus Pacearchaeota archaeon]